MKFTITAAVLCLSSFATAYTIADLPSCSISCFTTAISGSGCGLTDTHCQCTTGLTYITNSVGPCLLKGCSTDDAAKAVTVSQGICKQDASSSAGSTGATTGTSKTGTSTATTTGTSSASAQKTNAAGANVGGIVYAGAGFVAAGMLAL